MTLANKLTWGRIAAIPFIAAGIVLYRRGETEWLRYAVIALFCAAILPDALDGAVIDFIDFSFFATFNVADMAVNIGVALLLVAAFWRRS